MNSFSFDKCNAMYFLAGALLPTLAWYYFQKPLVVVIAEEDNSDNDSANDSDNDITTTTPTTTTSTATTWTRRHAPYKMVFLVNLELKPKNMSKGKMAAQCGHAAVGCYEQAVTTCPTALRVWKQTGCAKIALQCPTQAELEHIAALAQAQGIPSYLVQDAGRTQIAAGSRTVLGLFGPTSVFTNLTDHLKLL